jgi:signal transduction histidine kinase
MDILNNLDLFSVGVAVAGIGILGFVVYFNDKESVTNRSFLYFSIVTILWGTINYFAYKITNPDIALWLLRIVLFFAVWQAYYIFKLFYVFPEKKVIFSDNYKWILLPLVSIASIITLTSLVLEKVKELSQLGRIIKIDNGPAIALFGIVSITLVIGALYVLIRKIIKAKEEEKWQFKIILAGALATFSLIITFNFIFPAFFDNSKFISLGAVFIFPFVLFTSYAILKHKLFDIKVVATATLAFVLSVVTFLEIIFSDGFSQIMFRSGVFILVLVFSIFLLKSVRKEVALREKIEELAKSLEKANIRLKELDRLKSEFVSFATHQIRAPLTAIKGYTSLIQEGSYGEVSQEVKGAVDKIHQASHSLVLVVEDYLNISRIEMGRMKYNFVELDFGKLVHEISEELTPNVKKAGLELSVDIDESKEYKAKIDEGKMRQVIVNLIDNAIKYTKKGSIKVSLIRDDEKKKLLLKVSDTGVGISKETMPTLFSKFIRAKNANEVNIHGTGLGLYIAREMAQAHKGGKLWAESEGEGRGSQFYVEIDFVK